MKNFTISIICIFVFSAWGHGDENHENDYEDRVETTMKHHDSLAAENTQVVNIYQEINTDYLKLIKPIFKRSCFDCHSDQTIYPWYYKFPGIKQFIDHDIKEAKEHLDFSNDFPFIGHEGPRKDLESIQKSISQEEMPPKKYLFMHKAAKLNNQDKTEVEKWVKKSLLKINSIN